MKRISGCFAFLALTAALTGCCYRTAGYDPCTGIAWGGGLEPCSSLCDPAFWGADCCPAACTTPCPVAGCTTGGVRVDPCASLGMPPSSLCDPYGPAVIPGCGPCGPRSSSTWMSSPHLAGLPNFLPMNSGPMAVPYGGHHGSHMTSPGVPHHYHAPHSTHPTQPMPGHAHPHAHPHPHPHPVPAPHYSQESAPPPPPAPPVDEAGRRMHGAASHYTQPRPQAMPVRDTRGHQPMWIPARP